MTPLISEYFSMIPRYDNGSSLIYEVLTVVIILVIIPIISFIALVGLVVGFTKAQSGLLFQYQALQSS